MSTLWRHKQRIPNYHRYCVFFLNKLNEFMQENIEFRHIVCDCYIKSPFKCSMSSACDVTACDNEMKVQDWEDER